MQSTTKLGGGVSSKKKHKKKKGNLFFSGSAKPQVSKCLSYTLLKLLLLIASMDDNDADDKHKMKLMELVLLFR